MKNRTIFLVSLLLGLSLAGMAQSQSGRTLTTYVNPLIGTGGHGHTFPGPAYPNGMLQPSPDTRIDQWDACSGYYYLDTSLNGFSHTHCSGTGCCDYGDVLLMPFTGEPSLQWNGSYGDGGNNGKASTSKADRLSFASPFSHEREHATPGYYTVHLDRYGIEAEMTVAQRGAIHRWTFEEEGDAGLIVDLDYSLQRQYNRNMQLLPGSSDGQTPTTILRGSKSTSFWAPDQRINFYLELSKPFTWEIITDSACVSTPREDAPDKSACKAILRFHVGKGEKVLCKVGISAVDTEGAEANVLSDIPAWDFEATRLKTVSAWEEYLSKIDATTTDTEQLTTFYTALYHTGVQPFLYTDADGRHWGMDKQVHQPLASRVAAPRGGWKKTSDMYTVYSLWDTFRAYHPLMTIIQPELNQALIRSLLQKADEGGVLPMWELSANYTATMIGYHAVPVIVDSYMKGQRKFDAAKALQACVRAAEGEAEGIKASPAFRKALMPASKHYQHTLGYAPFDNENETVAKGLEYAYDDWCISQMASAMLKEGNYGQGLTDGQSFTADGLKAIAERFQKYGQNYRNYYDASTGFMRGKDLAGNWRTPFSPYSSEHRNDDYCEGTAWQWTWFAPHDIQGLVKLMGGKKKFTTKLDSLFTVSSQLEGTTTSVDISGLIGQYAHGNEPSHATIHYYNYIDQPWKTQELCDSVLHSLYRAEPDGLSGNEDCGQMSAWYILNAMGFYQVAPGNPTYSIGRPLFDEVSINLPEGRTFRIVCHDQSRQNKYVSRMTLNGKLLKKPFFTHEELMAGGTLELWMSATR